MYPISKLNKNITQGPKSSQEFNKLCEDIRYDISTLFQETNRLTEEIIYNMNTVAIENFFLQRKIANLENRMTTIQSIVTTDIKTKIASFKTNDNVLSHAMSTSLINTSEGIAMIPNMAINKNLILDQNLDYVTPPDLEFDIYESIDNEEVVAVEDSNKMRTFDGNSASIWWHATELEANTAVDKLYIVLRIKLPLSYINNVLVNAICFKPFPENSMKITNVYYKAPNTTALQNLPNFPIEGISNAENILLHFPALEIEEIYVLLEQPYYFLDKNSRTFIYGMQEIAVYYIDFKAESSYIVTEFDLGDTGFFRSINEPIVTPAPGCPQNIADLVSHQIFFDLESLNTGSSNYVFSDQITPNYSKAYVLTKLKMGAGFSPVLSSISLSYLTQ